MATSSSYYLNAPSIGSATSIFVNADLTVLAADGFYSDGVIVREQVSGVLLPQQTCPTCATPCGGIISASGQQGVYLLDLSTGDTSSDVGAVVVTFNPQGVPDGIRATLGTNVYNKLSSSVDGLHQSTIANNITFVGAEYGDCGISGTTYPALVEFRYNGTAFVATGGTQSITVAPGDVSLSSPNAPGNLKMVIPKTTPSPSIINFEVVGPCSGTVWQMAVACPVLLTGFSSSIVGASSEAVCELPQDTTYYSVPVSTPGIISVYDFVFVDAYGAVPLDAGFYKATGSISGDNDWFEVDTNGIVIAIGICVPPAPECDDRTVVFQICNSNAQKDDNFDIYLNDVYIGAVDLNFNAQVGSVFIADLNTSVQITEPDFVCPLSGMVVYHFNPAILQGVNVLEMRNTQNNGNGNFGTIGMRNYLLDGTDLISPCVVTNLEYSGSSGASFTFNFDYTNCCAPVWYQLENCDDSSIGYSEEYVDGDFEINERVTSVGITWVITGITTTQPSGTLLPITTTGFTGCPIPVTYNCVSGNCIDPGDGSGTYATLQDCEANCVAYNYYFLEKCSEQIDRVVRTTATLVVDVNSQLASAVSIFGTCYYAKSTATENEYNTNAGDETSVDITGYTVTNGCDECQGIFPESYDCISGNCVDPGDGSGAYSTLQDCEANCTPPVSYNCVSGNCIDPGDGTGTYATLQDCEANCTIPVTYNCEFGNCVDPGDGTGTYATLQDCEAGCTPPACVEYFLQNFDLVNDAVIDYIDCNGVAQVGVIIPPDSDLTICCYNGSIVVITGTVSPSFNGPCPPPATATLDWAFTLGTDTSGSYDLYVNGSIVESRTDTDNGLYTVNVGDTINIQVVCDQCVFGGPYANVYSTGILIDSNCVQNGTASILTTTYTVMAADAGTTLSLSAFAVCEAACL